MIDLLFLEQLGFAHGTFESIRSVATLPKGPLLEPEMQARVHGRRAFKTGGRLLRGGKDVRGCVTKAKLKHRSRIEVRQMKSEPLVALYPAYLQPQLIEVFCFGCHRLIGATPRTDVAEILRRLHVERETQS